MLKASLKKKLRDFDIDIGALEVADGETLGLLGDNGSGKSTILKMIAGLMKPDEGRIELNNEVIYDSAAKRNVDAELRNIGYMFQNYALFPNMTVRKNILYGLKMHKFIKEDANKRADELIEKLSLTEIADQPVTRLSGGQCQRVALARALAPHPLLLLLDEPLSALDARTQDKLRLELVRVIHMENIPCIIVTHTAKDALAIADRICIIERGHILEKGQPEDIVYNPKFGFVTGDNPNQFRGTMWTNNSGAVCVKIGTVDFRTVSTLEGDVNVSIRPENIIISRERFESSAINVFEGEIVKILPSVPGEVFVFVDIGIPLAAAITEQSLNRLNLSVEERVIITFKAASVEIFT